MTTTNINSVDFKNAKEEYFNKKIIFYFLAFLPISLILGNTIITLNILIIDLLFLFICLCVPQWSVRVVSGKGRRGEGGFPMKGFLE